MSLIFFLLLPLPALAGGVEMPCTAEDSTYSKQMGYGDANIAYGWGLKIQAALRNKDLAALFAMVDGELSYGPRKAWALRQKFEDVLPVETVARLLAEAPSCGPVGWRGYMLGRGALKFQPTADSANITALLFTAEEKISPAPPIGWPYADAVLSPECFERKHIAECPLPPQGLETRNGYVGFKRDFTFMDYKVMAEVDTERCQQLAPAEPGTCQAGYLIDWGSFSGGTIGRERTIAIYGLFDLPNYGPSILPLKFFSSPADALNYVIDGIDEPAPEPSGKISSE